MTDIATDSRVTNGRSKEEATAARDTMIAHLRKTWLGPAGDANELLERSPVYSYLVGTLYPVEVGAGLPKAELEEEADADVDTAAGAALSVIDLGDEEAVDPGDEEFAEDEGLNLTGAFGWAPNSFGMSFIHDGDGVDIEVDAALYSRVDSDSDGPDDNWQRVPLPTARLRLPDDPSGSVKVFKGRGTLSWRSRFSGLRTLTTVSISNAERTDPGSAKSDPSICLFQVQLTCSVAGGSLLPYPESASVSTSAEDRELELRYRERRTFGIGHGTAVEWEGGEKTPSTLRSVTIPSQEVPAVRALKGDSPILRLSRLADESIPRDVLTSELREFAAGYAGWVAKQEFTRSHKLDGRYFSAADDLIARLHNTMKRIDEGIRVLEGGGSGLTAFRLANKAMRDQMLQAMHSSEAPGDTSQPLALRSSQVPEGDEPTWRPFQLGFILLSLASTIDSEHPDREAVDLIWFPTGGGKTEAYLGLAAIEMIRRRLDHSIRGGGTAVITRYTMRLLTAQQFQRASTLICALAMLRKSDPRLTGTPEFTIGLWLGNTTTPGTLRAAAATFKSTLKEASPVNTYQVRQCPWCATSILPPRRTAKHEAYGVRATNYTFEFFCPHADCPFHERLPLQVVDEAIYASPPSMLVATVDKFARLAWINEGASLFGLGSAQVEPPSLVIQDELHLITGPLGTVVGVYEAALRGLMSWAGTAPKVIASTATIRAAAVQVRELMASRVEVFPPSGLDADDNYFSEPDPDGPARTYIGLMPQAHTPSWALGQISSELLQAPVELALEGESKDAYWTLIVYHNSLRELGRTVTILRDDVRSELDRRRASTEMLIRKLGVTGIDELNGNVESEELLRILDQLGIGPDDDQEGLDALATTNIMSVGIDVTRLGLMLVNGQPKSTSEYIQATSRVGRGKIPGLVVTMFRSGKPRDRSVFETFGAFHRSYYRYVEPASVTPWSLQARRRALRAALVILMRHGGGLSANEQAAAFTADSVMTKRAVELLRHHVGIADSREAEVVDNEIADAVHDWAQRAEHARTKGIALKYRAASPDERLLKQFTDVGRGWPAMNSMRSVDRVVRVRADGER